MGHHAQNLVLEATRATPGNAQVMPGIKLGPETWNAPYLPIPINGYFITHTHAHTYTQCE